MKEVENQVILERAQNWVQEKLKHDSSGHDWWHIERVRRMAVRLARISGANLFICELAALLHDIVDDKLFPDQPTAYQELRSWFIEENIPEDIGAHVIEIISTLSFKGGNNLKMRTLEGQVVQDADRLDALGAIGAARTFAYSGWKGQAIYDPTIIFRSSMTKEQYRNEKSTAINHFYEKLLRLRELMNTEAARKIAEGRHKFMEDFLMRFDLEWQGTDE
jgi:uncharacterized protein